MAKNNTNTLRAALSEVAAITNTEFWDMARRFSPSFKSHTAEGTAQEFNEKGFEQISLSGTNVLNEFFEISMRIAFQLLSVSRARNPLRDRGLIQVYDTPNGGFVQRMAVHSLKPVSPAYRDLENGDSVDPYIVRKPTVEERFFQMNFDYQSFVSVQDYQMKTMFISPNGMGELLSGILEGLANGYTIQEYLNAKECMNAALNSTQNPLKDSQVVNVGSYGDVPTEAELKALVVKLKNLATSLTITPQTGMYNALSFESVVDPSDMVLVLRAGVRADIDTGLMVGAFNPEYLSLPFEIVEVDDFGGLEHYADAAFTTPIYPVYDKLGVQIGWSTTEGAETPGSDITDYVKDPNANVLGMLMQRGAIFESNQNPYTVQPIYNPRGLYTNYWANRPQNGINYDALYNVIAITKTVESGD